MQCSGYRQRVSIEAAKRDLFTGQFQLLSKQVQEVERQCDEMVSRQQQLGEQMMDAVP